MYKTDAIVKFMQDHYTDETLAALDMVAKGRQAYGERNGSAKLTNEQVLAIRNSKETAKWVREFGIARTTVKRIRNGRNWKCLL